MTRHSALNIKRIRQDFPILNEKVNEKPLVYLDNAATTQKPVSVMNAVTDYYHHYNANVHRGLHYLSEKATVAYEKARESVKHFLNARSLKECIFTKGTTEAINLVANSYVLPRLNQDSEILITHLEHHSNIVPWQILCERTGAKLMVAPIDDDGDVRMDVFKELLSEKTAFVAISHISNALGTINPVKDMVALAKSYGVRVLVDGAQAAPHLNLDVQALDCDFYAFSAHKMYGPTGVGVLWGREALLERMIPYQGGGEMIISVSFDKTEYAPLPHKFEAGTPNIAGVIGFKKAIDYLMGLDMEEVRLYESTLLTYADEALRSVNGLSIVGEAKEKASVISFVLANVHAHDVGTILNTFGIAVRSGHHCAMPVMSRYALAATTRASFSFYNTREEVDVLVESLHKVSEVLR